MSKIDLNHVWDDAKAMGRANSDLLIAIAGMFLLLPGILADQLMSAPPMMGKDAPSTEVIQKLAEHFAHNWPVLLAHGVVTSFGTLALLALLLRPERLTVGESLKAALVILPGYFVASLLQGLCVGIGVLLFIVPGLYLVARFALIAAVAAAEQQGNPITLLRRSLQLTRGNGWRIFALLAILFATAMIVSLVANTLIGLAAALLLPADVAALVLSIVTGLLEAGLGAAVALVTAALYRAATMPAPTPWAV